MPEENFGEKTHNVRNRDGLYTFKDSKGAEEEHFDEEKALAILLLNDVVFLNSHWYRETWPEKAKKSVNVIVNCNDVFAWGMADGESAGFSDIEKIYRMWLQEPKYGAEVWCLIQRRQLPQAPVAKRMREAGWDLDALATEHGLRANYYDGVSRVRANVKRRLYEAWCKLRGKDPLPFDGGWWTGWREYTTAEPGWQTQEVSSQENEAVTKWRAENGWDSEEEDDGSD